MGAGCKTDFDNHAKKKVFDACIEEFFNTSSFSITEEEIKYCIKKSDYVKNN